MTNEKRRNKFTTVLARNTVWMLLGQGLRLIIRAVYFIEIARSLGTARYGAFIGVVALVGIASPFGDLGSGSLLVKNVSRHKNLFSAYWGRALAITLAVSSVLTWMVFLISILVLPASIPRLLVLVVAISDILGLSLITISSEAFQAFDRLNWTAIINVLISASRLVGATVLIAFHSHPSPLQWGYSYLWSTWFVAAAGVFLVWWQLGPASFGWRNWTTEFREGLYFSTGQSAQTIYDNIDKTMLARLGTLEATGIYGAAYRFVEVCFVPVSSLLQASYSSFFRMGAKGIESCFAYAKPLLLSALGYAVGVSFLLFVCAGFIPSILGSEYARTTEALRWLAILPILKVVSYFFSNTLTGAGYQGSRACIQVGVGLFNILVNLWIIPLYSWRGAAWSSLASDTLLAVGTGVAVMLISQRERTRTIQEAGALI